MRSSSAARAALPRARSTWARLIRTICAAGLLAPCEASREPSSSVSARAAPSRSPARQRSAATSAGPADAALAASRQAAASERPRKGGALLGGAEVDDLDAAVALPAFLGVIGRHRVVLAVADGAEAAARHALGEQIVLHRDGALGREVLVVFGRADSVGVPLDREAEGLQLAGCQGGAHLVEQLARLGLELRGVELEEDRQPDGGRRGGFDARSAWHRERLGDFGDLDLAGIGGQGLW